MLNFCILQDSGALDALNVIVIVHEELNSLEDEMVQHADDTDEVDVRYQSNETNSQTRKRNYS
ncbi:hypothetical protein JG687_00019401 [Phytophthora cactorum]|uniref:Uncharacterized protein n=1 Tax=Phytophthora cactorum TaxID=29920 RepID=A0A329RP99_9STRA|nr:hypothetical protein PC111_g21872 [Phytophthora cactorum]KAG2815139.1 hypothetical protein PC112_g14017 [Phytophthora cactorum]KAG2839242.1 hypothetical protein PC113_g19508 [Phytophthora cactorum]KAG2926798.1 hypothetical protein PC117_g14760 [Phytophthora cactorum]KAG2979437.1 hypothetical protein PC119_g21472 [Phytophthora cactorum]